MANIVVKTDAATPAVATVVQAGSQFAVNSAIDVDSSSAPNDGLLIWNSTTTRYEIKAFTDLAFDAGLMD
jgi:hypothetical protein